VTPAGTFVAGSPGLLLTNPISAVIKNDNVRYIHTSGIEKSCLFSCYLTNFFLDSTHQSVSKSLEISL